MPHFEQISAEEEHAKLAKRRKSAVTLFLVGASILFAGSPALACSPNRMAAQSIEVQARSAYERADAIVDGVIVDLGNEVDEARPAILRPTRVLNGPKLASFSLWIAGGACTLPFRYLGEKVRLVLRVGGGGRAD